MAVRTCWTWALSSLAAVAALAHAVAVDGLADGALDGGPQRVAGPPFLDLLLGPGLGLDVVELSGQEGHLPGVGAGRSHHAAPETAAQVRSMPPMTVVTRPSSTATPPVMTLLRTTLVVSGAPETAHGAMIVQTPIAAATQPMP
jgi:hypothetical protein